MNENDFVFNRLEVCMFLQGILGEFPPEIQKKRPQAYG